MWGSDLRGFGFKGIQINEGLLYHNSAGRIFEQNMLVKAFEYIMQAELGVVGESFCPYHPLFPGRRNLSNSPGKKSSSEPTTPKVPPSLKVKALPMFLLLDNFFIKLPETLHVRFAILIIHKFCKI